MLWNRITAGDDEDNIMIATSIVPKFTHMFDVLKEMYSKRSIVQVAQHSTIVAYDSIGMIPSSLQIMM